MNLNENWMYIVFVQSKSVETSIRSPSCQKTRYILKRIKQVELKPSYKIILHLDNTGGLSGILTPLKMSAVPDFRGSPLSVPLSAPYTSGQISGLRFSLKFSFTTDGRGTKGTQ